MQSLLTLVALSILTWSALSTAKALKKCPATDVCVAVGVPEASADSGDGNIYLQFQAPTTYSWVAFGTGRQMSDSNIFVIYADGAGNVTVSARGSANHVEPQHQTNTQLTLLAGSGIINDGDTMLANVRCANCESWDGGSLTLTSSSAPFIAAWKKGSALNSKDLNEDIAVHDSHSQFSIDLTSASVTSDSNPFVESSSGGSSSGGGTSSGGGNSDGDGDSSDQGDDGDTGVEVPGYIREIPTLIKAHGILMAIIMVILYPVGSLLMPLVGNWIVHAAWQGVAFSAMWAGFALGIVTSQRTGIRFSETHTLLGTVVVALFGFQPVGGYIHHLHYQKHQTRGLVSHGHIWYGRILMLLGIINGGLGLQLAQAEKSLIVAYAVVAVVVYVIYIVGAVFGEVKRNRRLATGREGKDSAYLRSNHIQLEHR